MRYGVPRQITIKKILPSNSIDVATGSEDALRDSFSNLAEIHYEFLSSRIRYNETEMATSQFFRNSGFLGRWELVDCPPSQFYSTSHHEIYRHRVFTGPDGKEYEWELGPSKCKVMSDHWSSHPWFKLPIVLPFRIAVSQRCSKAPSGILPPSKLWDHRRRSPTLFRNFSRRTTYSWPYICHIHFCRKTSEAKANRLQAAIRKLVEKVSLHWHEYFLPLIISYRPIFLIFFSYLFISFSYLCPFIFSFSFVNSESLSVPLLRGFVLFIKHLRIYDWCRWAALELLNAWLLEPQAWPA